MLWHCWLGGRKGVRPVKKLEWWDAGVYPLSGVRCRFACDRADATATLSLAPVNPDRFYLLGFTSLVPGNSGQNPEPDLTFPVLKQKLKTHLFGLGYSWDRGASMHLINTLCMYNNQWLLDCCDAVGWNLGGRKGIQPVKKLSGGVQAWLSVLSKVQICIWPSWCHCH